MNTHVKTISGEPADLSRRSFLVGSAAAGLALGYSAVPGLLGADQALAAAGNFDPSVWYSIAPDGIVTVTCGKADMGQHIASTMAQIVSEELGSNWKDMRVQLASNDPKFNDPVLGAQITGGSWSTMMNFEAMSRAGAAGRIALTEAAAASMGVPAGELVVRDSTITHPKSKKTMSFADIVKSGKITKTFTPDELKAIKLKTPDQYTMIGVSVPQLDIPAEDQRHGQIRHRRHAAGHAVRPRGDAAGALRRHREGGRRQRGEESAGLRQGGHARRQDRQHHRLGGGGGQHLCQRGQGGGRAQDQL